MKSGLETSVGLTRSLNILQLRQKKTAQGLFHLAHLLGLSYAADHILLTTAIVTLYHLPQHVPPPPP